MASNNNTIKINTKSASNSSIDKISRDQKKEHGGALLSGQQAPLMSQLHSSALQKFYKQRSLTNNYQNISLSGGGTWHFQILISKWDDHKLVGEVVQILPQRPETLINVNIVRDNNKDKEESSLLVKQSSETFTHDINNFQSGRVVASVPED